MAATPTKFTGGTPLGSETEVHHIVWTSTTATVEVPTGLSEIYHAQLTALFGADAGHTDDDVGVLELDETVTNGVITVVSGNVTINRIKVTAAGTLAGQQSVVVLYGKS